MKKCWICGKEATKYFELSVFDDKYSKYDVNKRDGIFRKEVHQREYCECCFEKIKRELKEDKANYIKLKKKLMFERALRILEKQKIDLYEYKDAIETVRNFSIENPNKFDSSHEMIACIILIDNEIKTSTQYKIGKYRVDFYLPELKVVLEIDGELHKNNLYRDNKRDIEIRKELGNEWEIVRIKTKYIEQNAEMLVEAIKAIKKEKQKIRKKNYGILPEWYSERNKAKNLKKEEYGDDFLLED